MIQPTPGKYDVSTHPDKNDIVVRSEKGIVANFSVDCWEEMTWGEQKANAILFVQSLNLFHTLRNLYYTMIEQLNEDAFENIDIKKALYRSEKTLERVDPSFIYPDSYPDLDNVLIRTGGDINKVLKTCLTCLSPRFYETLKKDLQEIKELLGNSATDSFWSNH